MKFKNLIYPRILNGLDVENVRAVHKWCKTISRKTTYLFLVEMGDFWKEVSNILEMVVYWKRYQSFGGFSLARGDISVYESIPFVKMQKLIEAVEMNSNREYKDIIDKSKCNGYSFEDVDLNEIENEFIDEDVNKLFEERVQKLMVSESKFEKIKQITQLDPYDLFLHKALILSLDMVSYFDSERHSGESCYETLERCYLFSKGLFTDNFMDSSSLGLLIDLEYNFEEDSIIFETLQPIYVAISINFNKNYQQFTIPKHAQFLCFSFVTSYETGEEYDNFLEGHEEFSNVRDLTIRFPSTENNYYLQIDTGKLERNILSAITRKRFPKLLRISIQGCNSLDDLVNYEILSELMYVEIINTRRNQDYEKIHNWSERRVHNFVNRLFIEKKDSLIHQLVLYANIVRCNPDANFDTIKEYYDMSREKFVACISHSSINEYYDRCYE